MKIFKIIILLAIIVFFASNASAVVVQKIYLKDGSVLNGYIQKQETNGLLTISTDYAVICVKSDSVLMNSEKIYTEADLNNEWVKWATENEAFQTQNGEKRLSLSDITIRDGKNGRNFTKVKVLEKGTLVKFLEMTPNKYTCKWGDVEKIQAEKRSKAELTGMDRIYQLRNGSKFEGEYAEETDSTLSLYLKDGSIMSFKTNDVIKYTFSPVNPNQDLFEQVPLIDIIESKSVTIEGVIIEQSYASNNDSVNYIIIQQENGAKQNIKVADIKATGKKENPSFNPLTDIILNPGEVVVNRKPVDFFDVTENGNYLVLEHFIADSLDNNMKIISPDSTQTRIVVEYRHINDIPNVEQFKLVKMKLIQFKKKKVYYGFSFKDLVRSVSSPEIKKIETSVNQTTKAEYQITDYGYYALYNAGNNKAIPIKITKD